MGAAEEGRIGRVGGQGEVGLSKHLTRQEKKTAPQASVSGMSTTHGHSLIHHTHTSQQPVFTPNSAPVLASATVVCFSAFGKVDGGQRPPLRRENAEGRKNSGNNKHGHHGRTTRCLFWYACHTIFFSLFSWLSGAHAQPAPAAGASWAWPLSLQLGCFMKDQTQSSHLHTLTRFFFSSSAWLIVQTV